MIQDPSCNPMFLGLKVFSCNWRYCSCNPQTSLNTYKSRNKTDILKDRHGRLFIQDTSLLSLKTLMYCGISISVSDDWCAMSVQDLHDISEKKSLEHKSLGTGTAYNNIPDLYSFLTQERQHFISLHSFTDYFEVLNFQISGSSKQIKNNNMRPILMRF